MAYRSHVSFRARSGAVAATLAVHLLLLLALMNLSRKSDRRGIQSGLQIIDLRALRAPEEKLKPAIKPAPNAAHQAPKPMKRSPAKSIAGDSGTKTVQPVEAPSATIGASPLAGSSSTGLGTGQGGADSGGGNGPGGNGSASTGGNDLAEPPRLTSPVLNGRDFSRDQLDQWPRGATVFLRLRVDSAGFVAECIIDRGTGVAAIDALICNMAHERLRFRPAQNRNGQRVAGWFGYAQPAPE